MHGFAKNVHVYLELNHACEFSIGNAMRCVTNHAPYFHLKPSAALMGSEEHRRSWLKICGF